jgi:hypothetical protein
MQQHQIVAIRKPNRYSELEHITHVKYDGSVRSREEVIRHIKAQTDSFYVKVGQTIAWVEVVEPYGRNSYIRTKPDGTGKDNLLSLPEC